MVYFTTTLLTNILVSTQVRQPEVSIAKRCPNSSGIIAPEIQLTLEAAMIFNFAAQKNKLNGELEGPTSFVFCR